MDLGKPIETYGPVDITDLCEKMARQPASFWGVIASTGSAWRETGRAMPYFYNDTPKCVSRNTMRESKSGFVNVLRYTERPLFAEITALIERDIQPSFPDCDIMRVQLAELPPGDVITPHRDIGILTLIHQLHVPLVTHADVKFTIARQSFFLEEGRLYDLNNYVVHSVENKSDVMRVHLLVDLIPHAVARAKYFDTEDEIIAAVDAGRLQETA